MNKSLTPKKHLEKISNQNKFVGDQYLSPNDDDFGLSNKQFENQQMIGLNQN